MLYIERAYAGSSVQVGANSLAVVKDTRGGRVNPSRREYRSLDASGPLACFGHGLESRAVSTRRASGVAVGGNL